MVDHERAVRGGATGKHSRHLPGAVCLSLPDVDDAFVDLCGWSVGLGLEHLAEGRQNVGPITVDDVVVDLEPLPGASSING